VARAVKNGTAKVGHRTCAPPEADPRAALGGDYPAALPLHGPRLDWKPNKETAQKVVNVFVKTAEMDEHAFAGGNRRPNAEGITTAGETRPLCAGPQKKAAPQYSPDGMMPAGAAPGIGAQGAVEFFSPKRAGARAIDLSKTFYEPSSRSRPNANALRIRGELLLLPPPLWGG